MMYYPSRHKIYCKTNIIIISKSKIRLESYSSYYNMEDLRLPLKYNCWKCGICCYQVKNHEFGYSKRIPIYPDEADKLIEIAKKRGIEFKIIEDLVFPDIKNEKILVVTYRIRLDNETQGCPFYNSSSGCTIHDNKPLACQAYPLALKRIDAFNFEISIDPLCNFVIQYYDMLEKVELNELKEIFENEYPKAEKFYRKNKKLIFKIRKLEALKKIIIPHQISLVEFNKYLKDWDRRYISVK